MEKRFLISILLILLTLGIFAQASTAEIQLIYYQGEVSIFDSYDDDVTVWVLDEGDPIEEGYRISTGIDGEVEMEMQNGSIIRLGHETDFAIHTLRDTEGQGVNSFEVFAGKFRAVAAALTGGENDYGYTVGGPSAVCGVRGTDFGLDVDKNLGVEEAYVLNGAIDYTKKGPGNQKGKSIRLGKEEEANGLAPDDTFGPKKISTEKLAKIRENMKFKKADPDKVKQGKYEEPTPEPETEVDTNTEPVVDTQAGTEDTETVAEAGPEIPEWLQELLGMEIGSVTIGEKTYAKAVIQPTFTIGKVKTSLYLPIIYEKDMFNPDYWYKPKGNNEWSFGTDQTGTLNIVVDVVNDLFLKIKYVQWGEQRDDFFFKVGNMDNFTIGHGLIMKNYANDADFPAIRRIGINLGVKLEGWGIETIVNDVTDPSIFGGRVYFDIGETPLDVGLSAVTDISPAGDLPNEGAMINGKLVTEQALGNPIFLGLGVDLDLELIKSDFLSIIAFADLATMLPVLRNATFGDFNGVSAGPATSAIITGDAESPVRNYGLMTGFFGNVLFIDYQLDFRYFTGTFQPEFFNTSYDRTSIDKAIQTVEYLQDPDNPKWDNLTTGIYGEAGYEMPKIFFVKAGYLLPMTQDNSGFHAGEGIDGLHVEAGIDSGIIPLVNLSGSISYDRSYFWPMLAGELSDTGKSLNWIDEYSVLNGKIVYGVNKNLDILGLITTAASRDENGDVIYNENGTQQMSFTFSLETHVHF
ncbi:MAG: FecR domain-containing protein [Spirochaetales bacterium]|nr:FecR domain-containing protein [Spirochaetales bacterium]